MGRPMRGEKLQKSQIKRIFKFVPSPTDHRRHIGKVLHGCTTAFLPLYKSI